jgi:hypothetical protein
MRKVCSPSRSQKKRKKRLLKGTWELYLNECHDLLYVPDEEEA